MALLSRFYHLQIFDLEILFIGLFLDFLNTKTESFI